jgi:hypothetical protein
VKRILFAVLMILCLPHMQAQNVEGQIVASQFGEYQVPGIATGSLQFEPATCQVSGGGKNFAAFVAGIPIKIVDSNPAHTEIDTPAAVFINDCAVSMTTSYIHSTPFYLTSGTGGLQEAINNGPVKVGGPNTIILNAEWYALVSPGSPSSVIAEVHGNTSLGLVDVTTTPYTSYSWSGSQYVAAGTGSVTYNQGASGAVTRSSTSKWQDTISIKDFGAVGDGAHQAADTAGLQNAVAAANATGKSVYVPAGNYLLNNSSGPVLSGDEGVLIFGDGPSSSMACQTVGAADCIASTGATGFGLANLSISFGPTATVRSSGYAVDIETCTNCSLEGVILNNGDLSGLRLASTEHTSIHNLKVTNFFANGIFTLNNQDLRVDGLSCASNGDACFEASWYDSEYAAHTIPCQNISATNISSNNDVEAILINACNNVSVSNFTAVNSAKEAVFIGQDPTTTTAHWPDRIAITNGTIYGSGYGSNPLNSATAQALYINVGTSPGSFISHLAFSNITATHISSWGLAMAELQNDDVQASNLQFYDVGNGNSSGCLQTEGNQVNLDAVYCTDVGTYGLYDTSTNRLTGTGLNFNAVSQVSGINAIYLATTATGTVNLTNISVNDTNPSVFSSEVYDASTTGLHSMWNIVTTWLVAGLAPTAANASTTYTYTDPGHSMVFRNGGMIQSFVPPNYYFLPTAGATSTAYVNGAVLYYQSKCWSSGAQQTESVGWLDQYPTLSTESFSFNQFGGCGFPITIDLTKASSVMSPLIVLPGTQPSLFYSAAGTAVPSCNLGNKGLDVTVTDATSPTYMGTYTSGGGITAKALCSYNGSTYAWLTH